MSLVAFNTYNMKDVKNSGQLSMGGPAAARSASDSASDSDSDSDGGTSDDDNDASDSGSSSDELASADDNDVSMDESDSESSSESDEDEHHRTAVEEKLIGKSAMGVAFEHCHLLLRPNPAATLLPAMTEWARVQLGPSVSARRVRPTAKFDRTLQGRASHHILQHPRIKLIDRKSSAKLRLLDRLNKAAQANAPASCVVAVGDFATYFVLFRKPPKSLRRSDVSPRALPHTTLLVCNAVVAYRLPPGMTLVAYRLPNHEKARPDISEVPWAVALFHGRNHKAWKEEVTKEVQASFKRVRQGRLKAMWCSALASLSRIAGQYAWVHHFSSDEKEQDKLSLDVVEDKHNNQRTESDFSDAAAQAVTAATGWNIEEFVVRRCTHGTCGKPLHTVWNKNKRDVWRKKCIHCGALQ